MFCHKCGTQIADGAGFCQKCGAKIINGTAAQQPIDESKAIVGQSNMGAEPIADNPAYSGNMATNGYAFKAFVDNHVRMNTKFQSADDLINNSKPMGFVWICVGVLSLIGLLLGAINIGGASGILAGVLLFGGFFGYCATFIASGIIRTKYRRKFYGAFEGEIDIERFRAFLDANLKTVSPYFHECGYLKERGGLGTIISNAVSQAAQEVFLACECGAKKKSMATICIRSDISNPGSGRIQYFVDATHRGFLIDGRAAGFLAHGCLIKTAPIMQAAIEYYLKNVASQTK